MEIAVQGHEKEARKQREGMSDKRCGMLAYSRKWGKAMTGGGS